MTVDDLQAYLVDEFPQWFGPGRPHVVLDARRGAAIVGFDAGDDHLRPGGTVSGPALMALGDVAAYCAILASIGRVPLAVTTSFSINFLRRPAPGRLIAEATLLKLGQRLAVCEVGIRAESEAELCAHAVTTYSIPPGTSLEAI